MNRTKFLTSLSALAAVFAFNGNAMAGTYAPSCDANIYTIKLENSAGGYYQQGETVCRGDSTCIAQQCPVPGTLGTITYGVLVEDPILVPTSDCNSNPTVTLESFSLYNEAGVAAVSGLEPGSALTFGKFEKSDGTVLPGGTYTLKPVFSDVNTYKLVFNCTASTNLPGGPKTEPERTSYTAGSVIGLDEVCQLSGYDIRFSASGTDHTGTQISILDITGDKLEGFKDGSTVTITANYTPKCVGMRFYESSANGPNSNLTDVQVVYFKNPADKNSRGTFYSNDTCTTSVTNLDIPAISGYTVRGFIRTGDYKLCKTGNANYSTGTDITTALNTADWAGVKPSGVLEVATGQVLDAPIMYCTAVARNCSVAENAHALCQLDVMTDGRVTYTNCCEAGYNKDGLDSTLLNATTCPANN